MELTREQVEVNLDNLLLSHGVVMDMAIIEDLQDTDSALRAKLEAMTKQRDEAINKLCAYVLEDGGDV